MGHRAYSISEDHVGILTNSILAHVCLSFATNQQKQRAIN